MRDLSSDVDGPLEYDLMTINSEEIEEMWQVYVAYCERSGTQPSLRDFPLWCKEGYYD